MLLGLGRRRHELPVGVDSIHNYYEHLVLEEITKHSERAHRDVDYLADVACVALNRLPPRYIRHNVDMTFFMSPQEMAEIEDKVTAAVTAAIAYVESREPAEEEPQPVGQEPQPNEQEPNAAEGTEAE